MPVIILEKGKEKRSFLFPHIPKTGGNSIARFFRRNGAGVFVFDRDNAMSHLLRCPSQHFQYELLDRIYNIDRFDFTFAVVRNPIARAKSDYLWAHRRRPKGDVLPTFDDWFTGLAEIYEREPYVLDNHIRPQFHFVGPKISKVYRFENGLENCIRDVLANVGVELRAANGFLKKENSAQQHHGRNSEDVEMTERTKDLMHEVYAEDFKRWYS